MPRPLNNALRRKRKLSSKTWSVVPRSHPKVSFEKMKQTVETEMQATRAEFEPTWGSDWKGGFFNNFRPWLPGNTRAALDIRNPNIRMGRTSREVIAEIKQIIRDLHIDPHQLAELQPNKVAEKLGVVGKQMELSAEQRTIFKEATVKLLDFALPIYVELRRRGYTHNDLVN